jgi:hypothetical protein
MREIVLRYFFEGYASAAELAAEARGARVREGPEQGPHVYRFRVERMARDFEVSPGHLVGLLDAVASGELTVEVAHVVCDWLDGGNEHFLWDADTPDGERVANALFWLGNPEINYPLTPGVLAKIRQYLLTGENQLTSADTQPAGPRAAG